MEFSTSVVSSFFIFIFSFFFFSINCGSVGLPRFVLPQLVQSPLSRVFDNLLIEGNSCAEYSPKVYVCMLCWQKTDP